MKSFYLFLIALVIGLAPARGQYNFFISCDINFEDNPCWEGDFYQLNIQDNLWQVCTPDKGVFDSAWSSPHAIVTDSTAPYPDNFAASFTITFKPLTYCMCAPVIGGMYKMDSDTLTDYGKIEYSTDKGITWIDALSDSSEVFWFTDKPVFTGRIHQWKQFHGMLNFAYAADTLMYRYTFISDGIQTNKAGWMLDNLAVIDHTEGIADHGTAGSLSVSPNPATSGIKVSVINHPAMMDVSLYDLNGLLRLHQQPVASGGTIDISGLSGGIYLVRVISGEKCLTGRFVKL